jgi:hypothetical protein
MLTASYHDDCSSETAVDFPQTLRRYDPEDGTVYVVQIIG